MSLICSLKLKTLDSFKFQVRNILHINGMLSKGTTKRYYYHVIINCTLTLKKRVKKNI